MSANWFQILVITAPPEVYIEKNVMLALPGDTLSCSASGIPPIYTAILRNSTVLVNATDAASTTLEEDGNYTCVATNRYGDDAKVISVTFFGKSFLYVGCLSLNSFMYIFSELSKSISKLLWIVRTKLDQEKNEYSST